MTPRENILHCLRRLGCEYVPIDMSLCESQVNDFEKRFGHRNFEDYFELCHRSLWYPLAQNFTDATNIYKREVIPQDASIDFWGVAHSKGSEAAFHMTRMHHPLKGADSPEEIASYPYPGFSPNTLQDVRTKIAGIHSRSLAVMGLMACTVWETAWYLRSMEELMMDMMTGDEKATILLDKITSISCQRSAMYAEADTDILELGDDIGGQSGILLSVELWREWLKPRLAKVINSARAKKPDILIYYHSCGYVIPFIEELIEIGVDILNPVQPECMSFDEVHGTFGDRLSFWGTIGTQSTLPFGTPDEVRETVRSRLKICGKKGGIVIGPTHLVEPEVPWENLVAMAEAAKEF